MDAVIPFIMAFWKICLLSGPYLLLGLILSGFIKLLIPVSKIKKWLGKSNFASVVRASLVGVPLPLCSCSVIPTAVTLRKSGASKASTSSFLISTPESGIDSMAVTYSLMDLPMTVLRPLAAFSSALLAGTLQLLFNKEDTQVSTLEDDVKSCCSQSTETEKSSTLEKFKTALKFAFGDLINDIALWLLMGLVLSALIDILVPASFFSDLSHFQSQLLILVVALPMYICASATTPIAATLVLKGASPGSALLLLLVGPATNISNLLVLRKHLGGKGLFLNIIAVVIMALTFASLTDYLYSNFLSLNWNISVAHNHEHFSIMEKVSAVLLIILIVKGIYFENIKPKKHHH